MKIHFFQRYHSKENVDTANAMLLLSRLYSYSPTKFYTFLGRILPENASVELAFNLQERNKGSVPDATITQVSFKVVVETKLHGDFWLGQLTHHLNSFKNEDYKILLTLDPSPMADNIREELKHTVENHNRNHSSNVVHRHITFEELAAGIADSIDERDYEIQDMIDDYREYCYSGGLIPNDWKRMRVQLAGTTIAVNKKLGLYYDNAERGFSGHDYLGLYNQKAVRAIGKITAIAIAEIEDGELVVSSEKGHVTEEMKSNIRIAIEDAKNYGYNLESIPHRYFFVDNFHETCFEKSTPRAPMGSRMFDLCDVLGVTQLPAVEEIAKLLKNKTWQ